MRIQTVLSATLLTTLAVQAQAPTLNAGNNTPVAGQVINVFTQPTWAFPGGTGEDILYGFWMLDSTGQKNLKYLSPSVTSSSSVVPTANLLFTDGGSDTTFYEYSSTGVKIVGQRSPLEGLFNYSDPAQELVYPCTFGTTWTDAVGATYTTGIGAATRVGTITGIADGYGTLQLPEDLVPNVLRVKVRRNITDQTALAIVNRISTTYFFFTENEVHPVLRLQEDSVSINGGTYSVQKGAQWMFGPGNVGIIDHDAVRFNAYPNPVADLLVLDLAGVESTVTSVTVVDARGAMVLQQGVNAVAANSMLTLDLGGLSAGLYTVNLLGEGRVLGNRRVVVR
ncbi:MAG: T9SS type A sorting domain-containing protein [Flavobacteriales bacterium]|nr:T9SS type A sorting domain-containing protein [Flavobacteriales bacterium]